MIASSALQPAPLPDAIRSQLAELVSTGTLDLPVLPEVASQVVQLCNDEKADARKLATLLHRDQAMAGHLMRMANSPLYAPKVALVSLDQVVSRLGMAKVREIALVISCQSKVFTVAGYEDQVRGLFRHSLAAGMFAQEIARSRRWNVEEAFLCGLLHDVGRPVLLQALADLYRAGGLPVDRPAVESAIGVLHARVGAQLVKKWNLPVRLAETIQFHHEPQKATGAMQNAQMTALADDLAHLLIGPKQTDEGALRTHPMLAPLNLYPEELEALLAKRGTIKALVEAIG